MSDLFRDGARKTLRPHQSESIEKLREAFRSGRRRPCLQAPTGFGKTLVAATVIEGALRKGGRACFTAPAVELIDQSVEAFRNEGIDDIGVLQSNHPLTNPEARVQVASVQTLARRQFPDVSIVLVDECHIRSRAIQQWMKARPDIPFIGLSATPWRVGMSEEFDALVVGATTKSLIAGGYLSPFRVFAPSQPDLSKVSISKGDFAVGESSQVMSDAGIVGDIVLHWLRLGENRPTLSFCVDRAHARHVQDRFEGAGIRAAYVDGFTDPLERKHIEAEFHARRIQVVCSVRTLVMGVDWVVSCIIDAAPTRSEMLFCQRIGRGLRVNPPWADLIVLDHAGNSARLGLVDEIHHDQLLAGKAKDSTGGTKQKETPPPKVCPSCAFVKRAGELVCPACGWKTAPPPSIKTVAGELVEIGGKKKPKPAWSEKQSFYSQLIAIQRERGRSDGWVGHTYRKKLGDWPPRSLSRTPELPSPAVRNFVRSCDIAFSKSRRQEVQR